MERRSKRLVEVLTPDELTALIRETSRRAPTGIRNRAMLLVMARCGLRVGEVIALQVKDVEDDLIRVWRGKGAKDRTVPIDPQTASAIDLWRQSRRTLGIRNRTLFCTIMQRDTTETADLGDGRTLNLSTRPGKPVAGAYLRDAIKRYARRAGIAKRVTPHTLRHTAATLWLREDFDIREVQELLGHASITSTQIYTHVFPETLIAKQAARQNLPL